MIQELRERSFELIEEASRMISKKKVGKAIKNIFKVEKSRFKEPALCLEAKKGKIDPTKINHLEETCKENIQKSEFCDKVAELSVMLRRSSDNKSISTLKEYARKFDPTDSDGKKFITKTHAWLLNKQIGGHPDYATLSPSDYFEGNLIEYSKNGFIGKNAIYPALLALEKNDQVNDILIPARKIDENLIKEGANKWPEANMVILTTSMNRRDLWKLLQHFGVDAILKEESGGMKDNKYQLVWDPINYNRSDGFFLDIYGNF